MKRTTANPVLVPTGRQRRATSIAAVLAPDSIRRYVENKWVGNLFVTVRAKNLRGLSGFVDTRFEQLPATIQNVPISTSQRLRFSTRLT